MQFYFLLLSESILNFRRVTGRHNLEECKSFCHLYRPHYPQIRAIFCSFDLNSDKLRFLAGPAWNTSVLRLIYIDYIDLLVKYLKKKKNATIITINFLTQ